MIEIIRIHQEKGKKLKHWAENCRKQQLKEINQLIKKEENKNE